MEDGQLVETVKSQGLLYATNSLAYWNMVKKETASEAVCDEVGNSSNRCSWYLIAMML